MITLPNPFTQSALEPSRAADTVAGPSLTDPSDPATVNFSSSCGGVKESPVSIPDYNGVKSPALVTAHGLSGKSCPLNRVAPGPQEASESSTSTGGTQDRQQVALEPPPAGASDEHRFVLDVEAFMNDIEPLPAFLIDPSPEYLRANEMMPMLAVLAGH